MPDRKPNLTRLWQAITTAGWNVEDHSAQAGSFSNSARSAQFDWRKALSRAARSLQTGGLDKAERKFCEQVEAGSGNQMLYAGLPRGTYMP